MQRERGGRDGIMQRERGEDMVLCRGRGERDGIMQR